MRLLKKIENSVSYQTVIYSRPSLFSAETQVNALNLLLPSSTSKPLADPKHYKRLKLSYSKIKSPNQIKDRHIKELQKALDIKTSELKSHQASIKMQRHVEGRRHTSA